MPPRTHITAHQLDQDQDLLTELRILSSLRPQDRISTNHAVKPVVRIQKPEFFRSVVRFFGSESRASNVAYIQSLLQRVIDRYTTAIHNGDIALQSRICDETESAIQGIRRLQQTYEDDAQFQASVNVSVDTVCIHLGLCLVEHDRPLVPLLQPVNRKTPERTPSSRTTDDVNGTVSSGDSNRSALNETSTTHSTTKHIEGDPFDYTRIPTYTNGHSKTDGLTASSVGEGGGDTQQQAEQSLLLRDSHHCCGGKPCGEAEPGNTDDDDNGDEEDNQSIFETF